MAFLEIHKDASFIPAGLKEVDHRVKETRPAIEMPRGQGFHLTTKDVSIITPELNTTKSDTLQNGDKLINGNAINLLPEITIGPVFNPRIIEGTGRTILGREVNSRLLTPSGKEGKKLGEVRTSTTADREAVPISVFEFDNGRIGLTHEDFREDLKARNPDHGVWMDVSPGIAAAKARRAFWPSKSGQLIITDSRGAFSAVEELDHAVRQDAKGGRPDVKEIIKVVAPRITIFDTTVDRHVQYTPDQIGHIVDPNFHEETVNWLRSLRTKKNGRIVFNPHSVLERFGEEGARVVKTSSQTKHLS